MTRKPADPLAGAAQLATPGEWLAFAEKLYARERLSLGQIATNAHDEALYLLLHTLGLPLDSDARVLARKLTAVERAKIAAIFRRRVCERTPAAYLTREAWLGDHRFFVDERVIIPRSYLLEIIPHQLEAWRPPGVNVRRAVDVCTGSGCLAILLAHRFPQARVEACDLSADALEVAKINVSAHRLRRVRLVRRRSTRPSAKHDDSQQSALRTDCAGDAQAPGRRRAAPGATVAATG